MAGGAELESVNNEIKGINELLVRVDTKLGILIDDFKAHKKDDDEHFGRIYGSINAIPDKMSSCKESLKTEIMAISRREFAGVTEFETFRATVRTSVIVGVAVGSGVGTIIIGAVTLVLKITGVI